MEGELSTEYYQGFYQYLASGFDIQLSPSILQNPLDHPGSPNNGLTARMETPSIAIVDLVLKGQLTTASPPSMLYASLQAFYRGTSASAVYHSFEFNIESTEDVDDTRNEVLQKIEMMKR